jgi:hypothetical protein
LKLAVCGLIGRSSFPDEIILLGESSVERLTLFPVERPVTPTVPLVLIFLLLLLLWHDYSELGSAV